MQIKGETVVTKFATGLGRFIQKTWNLITLLRRGVGNLLFVAFLLLLAGIWFFRNGEQLPQEAALVLAPVGNIVEQTAEPLLVDRYFGGAVRREVPLNELIDGIDHAAGDEKIKILLIDLRRLEWAGISKLQEVGAALKRFRLSGKQIIAFGEFFNQQQYYLAAHADRIYLHPMGQVWISGYGVYRKYMQSALDKLMIRLHVFRVGTYKSALEPFYRNDMSPEAKEANTAWLEVLWEAYKSDIAELRGINPSDLEAWINAVDVYLAKEDGDAGRMALNLGLVDALKTRDEVREELIRLVGKDAKTKTYKQVPFERYFDLVGPELRQTGPERGKVGIIVARGVIMNGKQPTGRIGGDSMAALIRRARQNPEIDALVLRVNSGGGSALASEIIRREVELTRIAGKPVVVSMSSVAASGGYWIAVSADQIWALPTTITGSIGIFAAMPTFDRSLEALGIHTDGVGTTQLSGAFDLSRPLNPQLASILQRSIERGYQQFIRRVAEGRRLDPAAVEKVARGRVWAGKTAYELGLVDALGGLEDAVQSAAKLADLDAFDVVPIEIPPTPRNRLLRQLFRLLYRAVAEELYTHRSEEFLQAAGSLLDSATLDAIGLLNDPLHTYALCLVCSEPH
jgi:protease-4